MRRWVACAALSAGATVYGQSPITEPELANIFILESLKSLKVDVTAEESDQLKLLSVEQLINNARNNISNTPVSLEDSVSIKQVDAVLETYEKLSQGSLSVERASRIFAETLPQFDADTRPIANERFLNAAEQFGPGIYMVGDNSYLIEDRRFGGFPDVELIKVTGEVYLTVRSRGFVLTAPVGLFYNNSQR